MNKVIDIDSYNITNKKDFYENGGRWVNRNCDELIWQSHNESVVLHDRAIVWGSLEGIQIQFNNVK